MTSTNETSESQAELKGTPAAEETGEQVGHDITAVHEADSRNPVRPMCPRCGSSWRVTDEEPQEEVVGYVVVATTSDRPETMRWMTPARYDLDKATTERAFWSGSRHLQGAGLRLAKVVLLPEDDPPADT